MSDPQTVSAFVTSYLTALGARVNQTQPGLFQVDLTPEQRAEMMGETLPPRTWAPQAHKPERLYLVFDPKDGERYPHAELVVPGSYRLDRVIEATKSKGRLAWRTVMPDATAESLQFQPVLWVTFRIIYRAYEQQEQLEEYGVDLTDGTVYGTGGVSALEIAGLSDVQPFPIADRRVSFKEAFGRLNDVLFDRIGREDPAWAIQADNEVKMELQRLENYFGDLVQESPDEEILAAKDRRLQEYESRNRPRVLVRAVQALFLYNPVLQNGPNTRDVLMEKVGSPLGDRRPFFGHSPGFLQ